MASAENKPQSSNEKLDCLSKRSLIRIVNYVEKELSKSFSNQENISDENGAYKSKILQMYKTALSANLSHEGKPLSLDAAELDTTSEYEPFDTGKEHFINHVLLDQLEQQMIATVRLRKTGPSQVHSKLKKLIRPELKHLCTVEVKPSRDDCSPMETDSDIHHPAADIEERLQGLSQQTTSIKQMCTDMLQRTKDLSEAAQIYHKSESSELQHALNETPPPNPDITQQNLFLLSKSSKTIPKKLAI